MGEIAVNAIVMVDHPQEHYPLLVDLEQRDMSTPRKVLWESPRMLLVHPEH